MTYDTPLLEMSDLRVAFTSTTGTVEAVRGIDLTIYPGESVAIVGESGSGKSTAAMAILGLLPGTGRITGGSIRFDGRELTTATEKDREAYRGALIGLVPQDPMSNLNPVWRVGTQVKEAVVANDATVGGDPAATSLALLEEAGLPDAERCRRHYPHELSGGMRQRALIAMGLAGRPKLLIADEPTSALDVTVQKRILDHLEGLTAERGTAVLFITHDLGLAAERATHLVVMHRGRIVEQGPSREILQHPRHPYTKRLVAAAPSLASRRIALAAKRREESAELLTRHEDVASREEIIRVEGLTKRFGTHVAVEDVSFGLRRGTTLALVGESGSGKSTVANMILNLLDPTAGKVYYRGRDLSELSRAELFAMRRKLQVVFQNPYGSLDPMFSVYRCIEEPLRVHGIGSAKERERRVAELLDVVALPRSTMRRYPNELSGGQRQRIALARALALQPEVVILDEAVSALDVLVQRQILELLAGLQDEWGLSYLFITHDLAVVRQTADEVVVMQAGRVVERGAADDIFERPAEDYTRGLIEAVPGAGIELWIDRPPTSDD